MTDRLHIINPFWLQATTERLSSAWRPLPSDWRDAFLAALSETGTIYGAAKRLDIGRGSVYYHKARDPEFAHRLAAVLAGTFAHREESSH